MDVANEAHNASLRHKSKKIEKPEWREYMQIFKDGDFVSRVKATDPEEQLLTAKDGDDSFDQEKAIEDFIDEVRYDKPYEDLLQYLSVSGTFNLSFGGLNEWNDILTLASSEGINLDFQFLESPTPAANPELGDHFQRLLDSLWAEDRTDRLSIVLEAGLPMHLQLKLALLGRQYSGKRTLAK